ncbi:MAG: S-layer homology domain-containing protein [Clostridia bacterium]|nr:S-layer homology domain-containing protein [Clostridia bacterium]
MKNGARVRSALRISAAVIAALFLFAVSVGAYSGSDYTDDEYLASLLDRVFRGAAPLFQNEDRMYPIGSSIGTYPDSPHKAGGLLGYECYIYANAVYYYLFGEVPFHGDSEYAKSTVPIRGGDAVGYDLLSENGINCGAYVRTTPFSDGSYNGNSGHSFIILAYDSEGIDVLQANNAGPGVISLDRMTWDEFDVMMSRYWGGYLSHVINPLDTLSTSADGEVVHSWSEWETTVPAGCYTDGVRSRVCADCGKVQERAIPARHEWSEGTVVAPATWDEDGQIEFVCSACGETRYETIPRLSVTDTFRDVGREDWFCPYVEYAYRNGLMKGVSDDLFDPESGMSRAMIVTVLWRIEGEPTPVCDAPFTDLSEEWYAAAVSWAAENGIVMGTAPDLFSPDDPLTREQIAAILKRYYDMKTAAETESGTAAETEPADGEPAEPGDGTSGGGDADLSLFPDRGAVSEYAREAVGWAVGRGLLKGTASGGEILLDPQGGATRAQVATILCRYLTS